MTAPTAEELLDTPDGFLTTTHLAQLGWPRKAIDAIFRECPKVILPGYTRNMIRVRDYHALIERSTYHEDRVHPARGGR